MTDKTEAREKRPRRWVKVLLVCSLALNLLIFGAIAGAVLSGGQWGARHAMHMAPVGGPLSRALNHEDRHALGDKMRDVYGNRAAARAEWRGLLEDLLQDLTAVPFDPGAVKSHLGAIEASLVKRQHLGRDLLIERLTAMTDEERADYARRLKRVLRRGR